MKKINENNSGRREMTVAKIRDDKNTDYVEVLFLESARFYRLFRKNPAFDYDMKLLHDSQNRKRVLKILLTSIDSDIITGVVE